MTTTNDGGQAFSNTTDPGLSIRDWFAGQALTALIVGGDRAASVVAGMAYEYADAMIAARTPPAEEQTEPTE